MKSSKLGKPSGAGLNWLKTNTTTLSGSLWPAAFVTVHPPPTQQRSRGPDIGVGLGTRTRRALWAGTVSWQKCCPRQERRRDNAPPGDVQNSQAHWHGNNSNTGNSYCYFFELWEQKQSFLWHIFLTTNRITPYLPYQSPNNLMATINDQGNNIICH